MNLGDDVKKTKDVVDKGLRRYPESLSWVLAVGIVVNVAVLVWAINKSSSAISAEQLTQAIQVHSEHPHNGAATDKDFRMMSKRMDRIEGKVDRILERLPK